jgi:hypothetical protein
MYGFVPTTGELIPRSGVPPIGVETSVSEEGQFGQDVELKGFQYG